MEYVNAFWAGGLICALVQILLDRTKLMPGRVMVLLALSVAHNNKRGEPPIEVPLFCFLTFG